MSILDREKPKIRVLTEEEIYQRMTPNDLTNVRDFINFAYARANGISAEQAGIMIQAIDEMVEPLKEKSAKWQRELEARRIGRRRFLNNAFWWGTAGAITVGILSGLGALFDSCVGPSAQRREFAQRQWLEEHNTLGLEVSSPSYSRWTVRYAPSDLKLIPAGVSSNALLEGTSIQLPGTKLNALENTWIMIRDHIRTTDNKPVGRLAIATSVSTYSSSSGTTSTPVIGEEWVLRDQVTETINANVLVLEHLDSKSVQYLSVSRSKTADSQKPTFTLWSYKLAQ